MKVLFVCLGNICRSPAAEHVFMDLLEKENLLDLFVVESAGTSSYHVGELPDARMREHAKKRGLQLRSRSRQFESSDFEEYKYIVVMDKSNFANVFAMATNDEEKSQIYEMAEYARNFSDSEVPDPYFGGAQGFEYVLDMVTDGCQNLLQMIKEKEGIN